MSTYYFAQTQQGLGDGSSAANAQSAAWFNTGANWSATPATSGKICPGDTVRLCGTVSTPLVFQGSGSAGNPISLVFELSGKMSAPTWTTAAILAEGDLFTGLKSDIIVDGGVNGLIEATDSGTNRTYPSCGYGVRMVGVSRSEVKNLSVLDLFVRTVGNDVTTPGIGVSCVPAVNAPFNTVSIHDCVIQNAFCGINTGYNLQGLSGLSAYNNTINYVNWGIQCGSEAPGAFVVDPVFYGNRISQFANWDEPGTNFHHHNAIFVWTNNSDVSGTCRGLKIYNNLIGPGYGSYATSGIYISAPGHRAPILIYNNIFNSFGSNPTNGDIFVVPGYHAVLSACNNTFYGTQGIAIGYGGDHGGDQTCYLRNNIVKGDGGSGKVAVYVSYGSVVTLDSDRNSFSGMSTSPTGFSFSNNNSASFKTFSQWQGLGYDLNSQYDVDPLLDSSYQLTAGSPARGAGVTLSGIFTKDYNNLTRINPWDMGAKRAYAVYYVAETSLGDGSGSTAANAKPITWLNTVGNWNGTSGILSESTKAVLRDEIHFVGTINTAFTWPYATGTGAAGILFYFEENAKFSAATYPYGAMTWESAAYVKSHITIDGGVNGIIECTDNGTDFANQVSSNAIYAISSSYVTIRNLLAQNMYVRNSILDRSTGAIYSNGFYFTPTGSGGAYTDLTIENCTIHDTNIAINTPCSLSSARYTFRDNEIYNVNWGIGCGGVVDTSNMTGFVASGNNIHDFETWDQPTSGNPLEIEDFHHNAIFLFGNTGTENFQDATIYSNTFGPNLGTRATSCLYISSYGMRGSYLVYNNKFLGSASNGLCNIGTGEGSYTYIFNNTFDSQSTNAPLIQVGGTSAATVMTVYVQNNIFNRGIPFSGNLVTPVVLHSDRNIFFNFPTGFPGAFSWSTTTEANSIPWATWQSTYGQDANSLYDVDPQLDADLQIEAGSPVIGIGFDLSAYFNTDFNGVTRTAPWDLGAFKFNGAASPSGSSFSNFFTSHIFKTGLF